MTIEQEETDAAAMNEKLREGRAARPGRKRRAQGNADPDAKIAAAKQPAAPRASRAKPKPVEVVAAVKQPFKMSYDGTTDRDYIAHRVNLGAR